MPDVQQRAQHHNPRSSAGGRGQVGVIPSLDVRNRVVLSGAVGHAEIDTLVELCSPAGHRPGRDVVLDFTDMTECPSALLLAVARIGRRLSALPVRLQIIGLDEALRRMVTAGP